MASGNRWFFSVVLSLLSPGMALGQEGEYQQTPDNYVTREAPKEFFKGDVKRIGYDRFYGEYAKDLRFDPVYGAADSQRVSFEKNGRSHTGIGGLAWIEPEAGTWRLTEDQLAEGRVIARIRTEEVVRSLGYGPQGWTYWWVDKQGVDTAGRPTWRSLFFSKLNRDSAVQTDLKHVKHENYRWRQSIAKWGGSMWGNCDRASCCTKE